MDTEEVPRMSGALSTRDDLTELASGQSAVANGDPRFLGVATGSKVLSRSPSVLNDVQMREDGDGDGDSDSGDDDDSTAGGAPVTAAVSTDAASAAPLSKNQQKRLKRQLKWEGGREDRKRKRKERRHEKQVKRRAAKREKREADGAADTTAEAGGEVAPVKERVLVPVSLIFDCAFESYMRDTELISLSGQITRSYSANRMATRQTRIFVSSWQGKLQERYETLLANQHKRWQHAYFVEEDFMSAGRQAEAAMRGEGGGVVVDVLGGEDKEAAKEATDTGKEEVSEEATSGLHSVVYLTSDSPHTLTRLEPYTSYVIGGIVDKNREKGLCYGRALEHGVRTAKLPIGDYMVMASRKVLTTNHVVEIMLQWLETGDWATAFERVMPKRKGGRLREPGTRKEEGEDEDGEGEDNEDDEEENEAETAAEGNDSQSHAIVDAEAQTATTATAEI